MNLQDYLAVRRYWEFGLIAGIFLLSFFANLGIETVNMSDSSADFDPMEPLILEGTSHIGLCLMAALIVWFERSWPIRASTWRKALLAHAAFSIVASLAHVVTLYVLRIWIFHLYTPDDPYGFDSWLGQFAYEYLKDFRTYIIIVAVIYLYRFVIMRLQGEAGFINEGQDESTEEVNERFLIKKLGREFLVRLDDVDWIESCGNYVNLHVGKRIYPLRDTMNNISERLVPHGFQRVHRSAIVNLDRIAEIVPFDTGDAEARLRTNAVVPVSRRFRKELRGRLA